MATKLNARITLVGDRNDHVWITTRFGFKCVICGGITQVKPPHPTPEEWEADRYQALTDDERAMCPFISET